MPSTGVSGVDLYGRNETGRWRFIGNASPKGQITTASFDVKPGNDNILYLPLYNGIKSIEIGIPKDKTIAIPKPSAREQCKPIVFYGTSITQGGCASRPGLAAPSIVGRELDVPVINLGFSANGKMEPEMANLIAELDPSIYVIDCLWNTSIHELKARAEPFIRILRKAHPSTPILLVEDSSFKNIATDKGNFLRTVYDKLTKEGFKDIYILSNKDMIGDDFEGTVDGCHLNDLGMMRQATVLINALAPILTSVQQQSSKR